MDPGISCIFWILAVTEQGFADYATLLSCNATLPAFTYSSSFFHLPVFFTGAYGLLLMFMPLPQPALDLTPCFHTGLYVFCAHSQLGGMCLFISKGLNIVISITHLRKFSRFYMSNTFPPFLRKHAILSVFQCGVLFLLGRTTKLRKN